MQETPYHFQVSAHDYTKDQLYSRASKGTTAYHFWCKNDFRFMRFQFNFIKPNNLEFLKSTNKNNSLDQIFSSKERHQYSNANF